MPVAGVIFILVCMLQAFIAEPSHAHAHMSEAVVMADRAAGCRALPDIADPHSLTMQLVLVACRGLMLSNKVPPDRVFSHTSSTQQSCSQSQVLQLLCACGQILSYDGLEDAILTNVDLFTHEVLKG